jgi:hypothetical protein
MEKVDKLKSALSSALSYLKEKSSIAIGAAGFLLFVIGFFSIPMYSFSLQAAIEVLIGGALFVLAFLIHSRSYFSGTTMEKAYALSITSIVALLTIGIILYSFSNEEIVFIGYRGIPTGTYYHVVTGPFPTYTVMADHIFLQFSTFAFGLAVVSAVFAVYLFTKVD